MFDIKPFLHPADPWPMTEPPINILACYQFKHAIALMVRPKRILEFGVRYGYSAAAFLAASPGAEYHGFDADNGDHGGMRGAWREADKMLHERFPEHRITVTRLDTQREVPPGRGWDLAHVDADHTYDGCLNDLHLATRLQAGWILVDDVDFIPVVGRAVRDFLAETGHPRLFFPTFRGDCLIRTSAGPR